VRWEELTIAIVGGDEREAEIARLAAETGATVRAYGFPWPDSGIAGAQRTREAAEALRGARYALFPVPGLDAEGALFAPSVHDPIVPSEELLSELAEGATIIVGKADESLRGAADALGIQLVEYESDAELMHLRAPAIVEGALQLAIEQTDVTIHATEVAVVGYGTIGAFLSRTLLVLGARVHVAARNPVQRAAAFAAGADAVALERLPDLAPALAMIFSTAPAPVVGRGVLELLPRGAFVMDLAAPPGSVDLALAHELGHRAIWARGLGRRAPITVGASQWLGIRRRIETIEGGGR
jgi:dipicolinate synthase subunit A